MQTDVLEPSNAKVCEQRPPKEDSPQILSSTCTLLNDNGIGSRQFYGDRLSKPKVTPTNCSLGKAKGKKKQMHPVDGKKKTSLSTMGTKDDDPSWENLKEPYNNPNARSQFSEFVGASKAATSAKTVLQHFLLLFHFSILDEIVKQTNLFYHQTSLKKSVPSGFKTSREELMAWFGIIIAMGIAKLPATND